MEFHEFSLNIQECLIGAIPFVGIDEDPIVEGAIGVKFSEDVVPIFRWIKQHLRNILPLGIPNWV